MSSNTLNNRSDGETIVEAFFNDIHSALDGDFVGRNSAGVPTAGQNLGTASIPWGTFRGTGLVVNGSSIDTSQVAAPPYRLISGVVRSASNQPAFIVPNGSALSFIVDGTPTSLVYDVNAQSYTLSADLTKSSLTAAPSSNNTCLVNDALAVSQYQSRVWGEHGVYQQITVDTMGSEITSLVGTYQSFLVGTEIFYAYVSSTTLLTNAFRGFMYNSSLAPLNRTTLADNATITLLKTGYVFLDSDGTTVDVTYNAPVYAYSSPSSPVTGDYWYDTGNNLWKRYDGATYQIVTRVYIGMVANSSTACIGARCVDFDARYKKDNNLRLEVSTTEIIKAKRPFAMVNVGGNEIKFGTSLPVWNITTDLAPTADLYSSTEQASRMYFLYLSDTGDAILSDIHPYNRPDLNGEYHPHNPWRCIGAAYNDASSNLVQCGSLMDGAEIFEEDFEVGSQNGVGATNTNIPRWSTINYRRGLSVLITDSATLGESFEIQRPGSYVISLTIGSTIGGRNVGFVKNDATNTGITALAGAVIMGFDTLDSTSEYSFTIIHDFKAGEYFMVRTDAFTPTGGSARQKLRINKVK